MSDHNNDQTKDTGSIPVRLVGGSGVAGATDTDHSGAIVTGGLAQVIMAANPKRISWAIQNVDTSMAEELGYSTTGVAALDTAGTFTLAAASGAGFPGGYAQGTGTGAISIIAATINHKFTAIETVSA